MTAWVEDEHADGWVGLGAGVDAILALAHAPPTRAPYKSTRWLAFAPACSFNQVPQPDSSRRGQGPSPHLPPALNPPA